MERISYEDSRDYMLPGDVIAFGGTGSFSRIIKRATSCNISHVGTILQVNVPTIKSFFINQIIESTSLGAGEAGVKINRMSNHIKNYGGDIWWLPLKEEVRHILSVSKFYHFLLTQVGKPYDAPQAIMSALDLIPDSRENLDKLFCSELVAAAFEESGILNNVNSSEFTPADVCKLNIFDEPKQLKGHLKDMF